MPLEASWTLESWKVLHEQNVMVNPTSRFHFNFRVAMGLTSDGVRTVLYTVLNFTALYCTYDSE